jgi:hypothetical protein
MENRESRAVRYRNRAELVRIVAEAEATKSSVARVLLLSVAQDYLQWAETLEGDSTSQDAPDLPAVKAQRRA